MRVRYRYNRQEIPPAPLIHVTVTNPSNNQSQNIPALVDTGAACSAIPYHVLEHLQLISEDEVQVGGFRQPLHPHAAYSVDIDVHSARRDNLLVVANDDEYALLGRDVLNSFRLILDGPTLLLELSDE